MATEITVEALLDVLSECRETIVLPDLDIDTPEWMRRVGGGEFSVVNYDKFVDRLRALIK